MLSDRLSVKAPDGYTIGIMNVPGLTVPPMLGKKVVAYNLEDTTWIGNLAKSTYAIAVKADSPINSLAELMCAWPTG